MIILAKQNKPLTDVFYKEFKNEYEAANYLKVHVSNVYRAMGVTGQRRKTIKGWYVDQD